jgi:hypothetical protein
MKARIVLTSSRSSKTNLGMLKMLATSALPDKNDNPPWVQRLGYLHDVFGVLATVYAVHALLAACCSALRLLRRVGGGRAIRIGVARFKQHCLDHCLPCVGLGAIAACSRYLSVSYWKNPTLSAECFLPDLQDSSKHLYLSRDIGYFDQQGRLHPVRRKNSYLLPLQTNNKTNQLKLKDSLPTEMEVGMR